MIFLECTNVLGMYQFLECSWNISSGYSKKTLIFTPKIFWRDSKGTGFGKSKIIYGYCESLLWKEVTKIHFQEARVFKQCSVHWRSIDFSFHYGSVFVHNFVLKNIADKHFFHRLSITSYSKKIRSTADSFRRYHYPFW